MCIYIYIYVAKISPAKNIQGWECPGCPLVLTECTPEQRQFSGSGS